MRIVNQIPSVLDLGGQYRRREEEILGIVFHRLGPMLHDEHPMTGFDVAQEFRKTRPYEAGSYTGGRIPYHFIINAERLEIYQTLPLSLIGPHARDWSAPMIGVAALGDWRKQEPSLDTVRLVNSFINTFSQALGIPPHWVRDHDELVDGSHEEGKICPGPFLSMKPARGRDFMIGTAVQSLAITELKKAGMVVGGDLDAKIQ